MNKIKLSLGILILALVFSLGCLGVLAQDKPPVVIGLQAPITGDYAIEGEMAKQCVETAARMINEEGGVIDGRMIEIEVADDAFQPRAGALAATKFISMDEIVAVI